MGANLNSSHLPPNCSRSLLWPWPVRVVETVSGTTTLPLMPVGATVAGSKMAAGGDMVG